MKKPRRDPYEIWAEKQEKRLNRFITNKILKVIKKVTKNEKAT